MATAVKPKQAAEPKTTPVVVTPQTWFERWKFIITPLTMLLLAIAVSRGWIPQGDADKIKLLVMTKKPIDEPEKSNLAAVAEASHVEARKVEAIDWKAIIDQLLPIIIDKLKPQPEPPIPPNPIPPNPIPPQPVPPTPTPPNPSDSKIVITDETGKQITAATVDAGALFLATSSSTGKIAWGKSTSGTVRIVEIRDNPIDRQSPLKGYSFSLAAGAFVEFHLTDSSLNPTSLRITANHGPQPPPNPEPQPQPIPIPPPEPTPPMARALGLVVFADLADRGPEYAVLTTSKYWQAISERHRVAVYTRSTNEAVGKAFLAETAGATGATLLIRDDANSTKLAVIPLPKTEAEFEAAIKAWSSR